ncbi:MAG: helix-turn-helix domain-containing protein [Bacteroidales bacterium]
MEGAELKLKISGLDATGRASDFLVRRYIFFRSTPEEGHLGDKHIPEGTCSLVFNFSGQSYVYSPWFEERRLPPFFMTLPYPSFINVKIDLPIDSFCVCCKTSVFTKFFGLKLGETGPDSYRMAADVVPHSLYDDLKAAGNDMARVEIFERFLSGRGSAYARDSIDDAYDMIFARNGIVDIDNMVAELRLNPRTARRRFISRVGISTKSLCRIVRANYVLGELERSKKIDFQEMVCLSDYFDQPHLVNDFKRFTGESPKAFFSRDLSGVKLFSGLSFFYNHLTFGDATFEEINSE